MRQTPINGNSVHWARIADRASGAAAGLAVLSGLGLLWISGKGMGFYIANTLFWLKMTLLLVASALIVRTKLFFRKHAGAASSTNISTPHSIPIILKFDFVSLVLMACLGVVLARG